MARWRLRFAAFAALGGTLVVAACGAEEDTRGGGASGTGGGTSCSDGEEQCTQGGQHQICSGTSWQDAPCSLGEGCDYADGHCWLCLCTGGGACIDATTMEICADDCLGWELAACEPGQGCIGDSCIDLVCSPGSVHCLNASTTEVCNADGTGYDPGPACGPSEQCQEGDGCQ